MSATTTVALADDAPTVGWVKVTVGVTSEYFLKVTVRDCWNSPESTTPSLFESIQATTVADFVAVVAEGASPVVVVAFATESTLRARVLVVVALRPAGVITANEVGA